MLQVLLLAGARSKRIRRRLFHERNAREAKQARVIPKNMGGAKARPPWATGRAPLHANLCHRICEGASKQMTVAFDLLQVVHGCPASLSHLLQQQAGEQHVAGRRSNIDHGAKNTSLI